MMRRSGMNQVYNPNLQNIAPLNNMRNSQMRANHMI